MLTPGVKVGKGGRVVEMHLKSIWRRASLPARIDVNPPRGPAEINIPACNQRPWYLATTTEPSDYRIDTRLIACPSSVRILAGHLPMKPRNFNRPQHTATIYT